MPYCQVLISETLTISDNKPPIQEIVYDTVRPKIKKCTSINQKIIVRGILKIGVQYVGGVSDEPVHFVNFSIPFDSYIETKFAKPGRIPKIHPQIEYYEMDYLGERTLLPLVILKLTLYELLDLDVKTEQINKFKRLPPPGRF